MRPSLDEPALSEGVHIAIASITLNLTARWHQTLARIGTTKTGIGTDTLDPPISSISPPVSPVQCEICPYNPCKFTHVCLECKGKHPSSSCNRGKLPPTRRLREVSLVEPRTDCQNPIVNYSMHTIMSLLFSNLRP